MESNGVKWSFWAFALAAWGSENMRGFAAYRSFLLKTALLASPVAALALAPHPTFAQRGGGGQLGGGGGHSSVGVGHAGAGSGHLSAVHVSGPPAPVVTSIPPRAVGAAAPSVGVAARIAVSPRPPMRFGTPVPGNHVVGPPTAPEAGVDATIGFPPNAREQRMSVLHSGSRSFYGQGSEIWKAPPGSLANTARPRTSPMNTTVRGGYNVREARPVVTPNPVLGNIFPPRRPVHPIRGPIQGGVGRPIFGGFGGFGLGLWVLNFGWGPTCGPYWGWGFGCEALPYYAYGYNNYAYSEPPPSGGLQAEPVLPPQENPPSTYEYPPPDTSQNSISAEQFETVLYLKDGTVYALTNYWLADGKLVYETNYGGQNSISLDQIDMQKTVDVNASRGVNFVLRRKPFDQAPNDPAQLDGRPAAPADAGQSSAPNPPPPQQ
jgi:hypothetical protein